MFDDDLRNTFAERFGERSLSQTVPHWQLGDDRSSSYIYVYLYIYIYRYDI